MAHFRYFSGTVLIALSIAGFVMGGHWVWLGFATLPFLALADAVLGEDTSDHILKYPFIAEIPMYMHFVLFPLLWIVFALWARDTSAAGGLQVVDMAGAVLSLGWMSTVPHVPILHEFLHRRSGWQRAYSHILIAFLGDPLRDLTHVHTHHRHYGSAADSDTAPRGMSMYAFAVRCTAQAFREGIEAEKQVLAKRGLPPWHWRGRIVRSVLTMVLILGTIGLIGGWVGGVLGLLGIMSAKLLGESLNYFQHYGIVREPGSPHSAKYAWSHLSAITRLVSLDLTVHPEHHRDAYIPAYDLRVLPASEAPRMPSALVCFAAGFFPPLWHRYIAMPRLKHWDLNFANAAERKLAAAANRAAGWPNWFEETGQATASP